jgi:hypothetical protein
MSERIRSVLRLALAVAGGAIAISLGGMIAGVVFTDADLDADRLRRLALIGSAAFALTLLALAWDAAVRRARGRRKPLDGETPSA